MPPPAPISEFFFSSDLAPSPDPPGLSIPRASSDQELQAAELGWAEPRQWDLCARRARQQAKNGDLARPCVDILLQRISAAPGEREEINLHVFCGGQRLTGNSILGELPLELWFVQAAALVMCAEPCGLVR